MDRDQNFHLGCALEDTNWCDLDIGLNFREDGPHIEEEKITYEGVRSPLYNIETPTVDRSNDVRVSYNDFSPGGKKPQITCTDQVAIFTQLALPTAIPEKHNHARDEINGSCKLFIHDLEAILFLDPVPAAMRDYAFPNETELVGNGKNLSAVLHSLWGPSRGPISNIIKSNRHAILSFIQSLPEQEIKTLDFHREPRGGVMVKLKETFGGIEREFDASTLSDGTLRVLSIAAAMLSAREGSLVVIEEIDNGVHPSRASHLLNQIQSVAQKRNLKVLLSTHNPALLDALPDEAVPDVVFCYRNPTSGDSRLLRLEDFDEYPELIAQDTLGRLVTTGLLDRFVKMSDPKNKKKKALAWLNNIQ
jgi:hypothetical protein